MYSGKPKSVLLVEDDEFTNKMNKFLIGNKMKLTDNIAIVHHGKDARDYFSKKLAAKEKLPELVLLDINMPVMNGYELISSIRAMIVDKSKMPVIIMLTSSSRDVERFSYGSYPEVKKIFLKPLTEPMLSEIVQEFFAD